MTQLFSNRHPAIGMYLITKLPHFVPDISVGLIQVMFFKFFTNNFALHFEALFRKSQSQHAITFEPESCFNIIYWQLTIIVGKIIGSIGIVFATGSLQGLVVIGDIATATKHQMFEKMSKSGFIGLFIPGTHIIQNIHYGHRGSMIFMHQHP